MLLEIGGFLEVHDLRTLATMWRDSLASNGMLLACYWPVDFDQHILPTANLHQHLGQDLLPIVRHVGEDFEFRPWSSDGTFVAAAVGIR